MYQVFTVYKSFPELYNEYETEDEAKEVAEELKRQPDLDDAYYQ